MSPAQPAASPDEPTGVILIGFGEPPEPTLPAVTDYLTRIFRANAPLEDTPEAEAVDHARRLAERRAPGLLDEYAAIDGSPLNAHIHRRARALEHELAIRDHHARVYPAMQFTGPTIEHAVETAAADGITRVIGLPTYPVCGPSTTVAALDHLRTTIDRADFDPAYHELPGWHRHSPYQHLRAANINQYAADHDVPLTTPDTTMVFAAHGTPTRYLEQGSRYVTYVETYCHDLATRLDLPGYEIGYQNHDTRGVDWTQPAIENVITRIARIDTNRVVVEPVSFIHEQSETLYDLDVELHEDATANGLEFHRVPIPHADDTYAGLFADLLEPLLTHTPDQPPPYQACRCRPHPKARCLNASLLPR